MEHSPDPDSGVADSQSRDLQTIARLSTALSFVAVVSAVLVLVLPPWICSQDLPAHLVSAEAFAHPDRFPHLERNIPTTGWGFVLPTSVLAAWIPTIWAAKLVLLAGLAVNVLSAFSLSRAWKTSSAFAVSVAAAQFVGWLMVMGFVNFLLAGAIGFLAASLTLTPSEPSPTRRALAVLVLSAAVMAHVVSGVIWTAIIIVGTILVRPEAKRGALASWTSFPLVLAGVSLFLTSNAETVEGVQILADGWHYGTTTQRLESLFGGSFVGYHAGGYALGGLIPVVVVAGMAFAEPERVRLARASVIVLVAGLVVGLLAPQTGLGWAFVAPRMWTFPILTAACLTPLGGVGHRASALLAITLASAVTIGGFPLALQEGGRLNDVMESFGEEPVGRAYAVLIGSEQSIPAPGFVPDAGTATLSVLRGGVMPGLFAYHRGHHWMVFREPPHQLVPNASSWFSVREACDVEEPACAWTTTLHADYVALNALPYDSVVAVGAPTLWIDRLVARGYTQTAPAVLRPVPASLQVAAESSEGTEAHVARVRYSPDAEYFAAVPVRSGVAEFPALPCGPLFIDVVSGETTLSQMVVELRPGQSARLLYSPDSHLGNDE